MPLHTWLLQLLVKTESACAGLLDYGWVLLLLLLADVQCSRCRGACKRARVHGKPLRLLQWSAVPVVAWHLMGCICQRCSICLLGWSQVTGYGTRLMNWTKVRAAALNGFQCPGRTSDALPAQEPPMLRALVNQRCQSLHPANHAALPCSAQHYAREMDGLEAFLTYADNNAVGYFSKQQFTKTITLEKEKVGRCQRWLASSF